MEIGSIRFGAHTMLTRLGLALLVTAWMLGASPVMAQTVPQSGNIYAAADLTPEGGEADPNLPISSATFSSVDGGGTLATVVLQNVQPNAQYSVERRDGGCAGAVLHELNAVTTDARGSGRSETTLTVAVEFGRWHVTARPANAEVGTSLLCGSVNPALAGPPVPISAPGMPGTGQPLSSVVWLVLVAAGGFVLLLEIGRAH